MHKKSQVTCFFLDPTFAPLNNEGINPRIYKKLQCFASKLLANSDFAISKKKHPENASIAYSGFA